MPIHIPQRRPTLDDTIRTKEHSHTRPSQNASARSLHQTGKTVAFSLASPNQADLKGGHHDAKSASRMALAPTP